MKNQILICLYCLQLKLLILYFKNKPIGGTLNFVANDNVVIIFYNMIDYNFANKKPAIHLICETIKWAEENHFKWLERLFYG